MRLYWVFSIVLFGLTGALQAQTPAASNPFELRSRLALAALDSVGGRAGLDNPFDVVPHRAPGASKALRDAPDFTQQVSDRLVSLPKGDTLPKYFILIYLFVVLTYFTLAVAANRSIVTKSWRSFLSANAMNAAQREALGFLGHTPYLLLYINFLLNVGVFAFLVVQALNPSNQYNNYSIFFFCLFVSILAVLLKHVLLLVMAWLFTGIKADTQKYNFLIIVFSCVLGFFLLPFNFVIAFAKEDGLQNFVAVWLLALSSMFVVYGALRAFSLGIKYIFGYPLHFLLYLCVAEIAPLLLIVKLFS